MKILLFGNSTWCIYNFRASLISALVARGCEVIALAPIDPTYKNDDLIKNIEALGARFVEVPLYARSKKPIQEIYSIIQIFRKVKSINPDVILTFTIKCNLYTGLCRKFLSCRQIANVPGMGEIFSEKNWSYKLVCLLYRVAFSNVPAVFFQNQEDLNFCTSKRLINAGSGRLIPGSGVNLKMFKPLKEHPNQSAKSENKLIFLMFGRLLPEKGYYMFLEAAKRFYGKAEFWVLGIEDKNREQSIILNKKIKESEARGELKRFEALVDVRPILAQVDVSCLPSNYNEGIPRSLLEAMAEGKAIITTDHKGCRETVVDGQNGYLIAPKDQRGFLETIGKMIAMGKSGVSRMGAMSRTLVEERFDEKIIISAYIAEIFGEVLPESVAFDSVNSDHRAADPRASVAPVISSAQQSSNSLDEAHDFEDVKKVA